MPKISTETALDFDYYAMGESEDSETVREYLEEYTKVGGIYVSYYPQLAPEDNVDLIFMEKAGKTWGHPIKVKMIPEYLEEVIENANQGIMILDTLNLTLEKEYFTETTKHDYPKIGDLIKIDYANILFEVTNVIDADAIFFGHKFTWKITGKVYLETHEQEEVTNEVFDPGNAPGETDNFEEKILDDIEEQSEEEYTYNPSDNPFGNY